MRKTEKVIKTYSKAITARKGAKYTALALIAALVSIYLERYDLNLPPEILIPVLTGTLDMIINFYKHKIKSTLS